MKNALVIIIILTVLITFPVFSEIILDLGVGYNFGINNFFSKTQKNVLDNNITYIEKRENSMGLNFNTGISYSFSKRFFIRGSVSINHGNQIYSFENPKDSYDEKNNRDEFLFNIKKINLDLGFAPILFKNGWKLYLLVGWSYNIFRSDSEMKLEKENYMSLRAGFIADFIQLKHLGFRFISVFDIQMSSNIDIQNISLMTNLIYRF